MLPAYRLATRSSPNPLHHICLSCRLQSYRPEPTRKKGASAAATAPEDDGSAASSKPEETVSGQDTVVGAKQLQTVKADEDYAKDIDALLDQTGSEREQGHNGVINHVAQSQDKPFPNVLSTRASPRAKRSARLYAARAGDVKAIEETLTRAAAEATARLPKNFHMVDLEIKAAAEAPPKKRHSSNGINFHKLRLRAEYVRMEGAKSVLYNATQIATTQGFKSEMMDAALKQIHHWELQVRQKINLLARDAVASNHLDRRTAGDQTKLLQWIRNVEHEHATEDGKDQSMLERPPQGMGFRIIYHNASDASERDTSEDAHGADEVESPNVKTALGSLSPEELVKLTRLTNIARLEEQFRRATAMERREKRNPEQHQKMLEMDPASKVYKGRNQTRERIQMEYKAARRRSRRAGNQARELQDEIARSAGKGSLLSLTANSATPAINQGSSSAFPVSYKQPALESLTGRRLEKAKEQLSKSSIRELQLNTLGTERTEGDLTTKPPAAPASVTSQGLYDPEVQVLRKHINEPGSQLAIPGLKDLKREISSLKSQIEGLRSDRNRMRETHTGRVGGSADRTAQESNRTSTNIGQAATQTKREVEREPGRNRTVDGSPQEESAVTDSRDRSLKAMRSESEMTEETRAKRHTGEPRKGGIDMTDNAGFSMAITSEVPSNTVCEQSRSKGLENSARGATSGSHDSGSGKRQHNLVEQLSMKVASKEAEQHVCTPPSLFEPEKQTQRFSRRQRVSSLAQSKAAASRSLAEQELLGLDKLLERIVEEDEERSRAMGTPGHSGAAFRPSFLRSKQPLFPPKRTTPMNSSGQPSSAALKTLTQLSGPRLLHTSSRYKRPAISAAVESELQYKTSPSLAKSCKAGTSIRARLRAWQEYHGNKESDVDPLHDYDRDLDDERPVMGLTRLPSLQLALQNRQSDDEEERERMIQAHFLLSPTGDLDGAAEDVRQLKMGDLVELSLPLADRDSIIAVFVRKIGMYSQLFTSTGKWAYATMRSIPYSVSNWASPDLVEPLLPYLPAPESITDMEEASASSYVNDLNVPREVAAPLVSKLARFQAEALDIYRRNANALDNAHEALSHPTDLRYGSLQSAASVLLKLRPDQISLPALFAVRTAFRRAGIGFEIDRLSHRLTGYIQIRSQAQVRVIRNVVQMLRDWQDDMAARALHSEHHPRPKSRQSRATAQAVYDFISKANVIIHKSRRNRDASHIGNVGPSKKKLSIGPHSDCVKETKNWEFNDSDMELVRFIEAWACANMFEENLRLDSLPPLLLHATRLYEGMELGRAAGFLFLQELGTVLPYENKVRFDPHLLLPSSQQSKPLANLMTTVLDMRTRPEFSDSMRHLRHDWKDLQVYCIDAASALEIDDGLSVEPCNDNTWWVHVHVANPTAFFDRDHPLSRMARHMGESIYMPERAHMMMPSWVGRSHFSLYNDRPCLTFSIRLDADGKTVEHNIRSAFVRNVVHLTPEELEVSIGSVSAPEESTIVLTVGGDVPPPSQSSHRPPFTASEKQVQDLKILQMLARKRFTQRQEAGGMNFNSKGPNIAVWETWRNPGLTIGKPHRHGSRTVEGDPIIEMKTPGFTNWFQRIDGRAGDSVVQEMMLLACETAAKWCAERQVPAIYRGTLSRRDTFDPETLRREVLEPAARDSSDGAFPPHLGLIYLQSVGSSALSSKPFPHRATGMDYYSKATSPLRRYGDMILHWQIEAALREEARTGQSLITDNPKVDRSFLPFSESVLSTIMVGLQPREKSIQRATQASEEFWHKMLLFRAHYYHEADLPFYTEDSPTLPDGSYKDRMRCLVMSQTATWGRINAFVLELCVSCNVDRPDLLGLEAAQPGDIWECDVQFIDVYKRDFRVTPVRLVHREKIGMKEVQTIMEKFKTER